MKGRIRFSLGAMLAAVIAMAAITVNVSAQPLPWNPPCPTMTVVNTTGCTANLTLASAPGIAPVLVPACMTVSIAVPVPFTINAVISQAGAVRNLVGPVPVVPGFAPCPGGPIVPPFAGPAARWVRGVVLGPAPGCCFDIFFYPGDPGHPCSVWLFPGTPPCTP